MSHQIKPAVTNPTIASIYQEIAGQLLFLQPEFQRKFVWTTEHQEEFIDTILNGYPFPEIYVCTAEIDVTLLKTTRKVIDGQQRLTTIRNYIDGVQARPFKKIPTYQTLTDVQKKEFLSYQVVMRDIGQVNDEMIREIFRRINLTKFKLQDVEIHNAIYDGQFIQTAKEIIDMIDLQAYGVFRESEFTRMADLHFILLIMSTIENGGFFSQDKEIENKIAEFNDDYPNKSSVIDVIYSVFSLVKSFELEEDSIWFRKSNFFTLVSCLSFAMKQGIISEVVSTESIKENLIKLENNIIENKETRSNDFGQYYSYMFQGTHNRSARVTRAQVFNKYVLA